MTTPKRVSAIQKKKKRLLQLRDAQRRRRERLKEESQHFVQIILPETVLLKLRELVHETGETLQHIIGRLVEEAIAEMPQAHPLSQAAQRIEEIEDEAPSAPVVLASIPEQDPREDAESGNLNGVKPVNQLDLFG